MTKKAGKAEASAYTPSPAAQRQRLIRRIMLGLMVLILAGSAMAWLQSKRTLVVLETNPPDPLQTPAAGGRTPAPYEYDAANDRHWHPEHGHWHPGKPPTDASGADAQTASAAGPTPPHNYYDPETDRHWHAPHGHWHEGKPPETEESAPMTTAETPTEESGATSDPTQPTEESSPALAPPRQSNNE